jgi:arylsulfatase A-like enzyme
LNLADDSGGIRKSFKTAKEDANKLGHVTNGPWRDGKGHPYEGGHRIPFIARWPGRIAPGTTSDYTLNLTDLFATTADILGQELPRNAAEDSISLLPVLLGNEIPQGRREAVFILGDGQDSAIAVCSGRWKLIVRYGNGSEIGYELYDLSVDPGEISNVSAENPEVTKRLADSLEAAEASGRTRP